MKENPYGKIVTRLSQLGMAIIIASGMWIGTAAAQPPSWCKPDWTAAAITGTPISLADRGKTENVVGPYGTALRHTAEEMGTAIFAFPVTFSPETGNEKGISCLTLRARDTIREGFVQAILYRQQRTAEYVQPEVVAIVTTDETSANPDGIQMPGASFAPVDLSEGGVEYTYFMEVSLFRQEGAVGILEALDVGVGDQVNGSPR